MRAVIGTSIEKQVHGPNKTLESADIRGIGVGKGVIVPVVVEERLIRGFDNADVR